MVRQRTAEECRDRPGEGERRGDETHLLVGEAQIPGDEGHQEARRVAIEEQEAEGDAEHPDETLFVAHVVSGVSCVPGRGGPGTRGTDRKSTRLNSSHQIISYAVFCLKKTRQC